MKWIAGVFLTLSVAMLLVSPASADPVTEPVTLAGINDVSLDSSSIASSNSGSWLLFSPSGAMSDLANASKLGAIAVERSNGAEPLWVNSSDSEAEDEEIAEAILNGAPAVSQPRLWAQSGAVVNTVVLNLDADTPDQADSLERTTVAAPEPNTLVLLGTGLFGLALILFRRAKAGEPAGHK